MLRLTDVHPETLLLLLDVAPDVLVVVTVQELAEQVEAVQLVEDLDRCAVALLAGGRVRDLERVPGEAESVQLLLGDHLVAHCETLMSATVHRPIHSVTQDIMRTSSTYCRWRCRPTPCPPLGHIQHRAPPPWASG